MEIIHELCSFLFVLEVSHEYLNYLNSGDLRQKSSALPLLSIIDNEKLLFNMLCRTRVLYENIKLRCHCQKEGKIKFPLVQDFGP